MIIVMQGRVRSTRLPGKGFFTFFGQTIWERMCDIAREVRGVSDVVFATGDLPENQLIRPIVESKGVRFFIGSEDNVLERFCLAVDGTDADYVIRITCDNYLVQPDVIENLAAIVRDERAEYGFVEPLSHFAGEVIRVEALREAWACGDITDLTREHVTWDLRQSRATNKVRLPPDYLGIDHACRLTLDTFEDLILMKTLEAEQPQLEPVRCLDAVRHLAGRPR
jgi:spore coat polysaccharide biosynthesis protein SpsF (cytidylyltransferase family)